MRVTMLLMNVKEIESRSEWDAFFNEAGSPTFLQSWEWGEFYKKQEHVIYRLGLFESKKLIAISLAIKIDSRRGRFLFVPHGPIVRSQMSDVRDRIVKALTDYLIGLGKKHNCAFIRIAPIFEKTEENNRTFSDVGYISAPIYMHAETVWLLDIEKNEDELLSSMRKTTRYLIKKTQKESVVIEKCNDPGAVEEFWKIYENTYRRERFTPFSKTYIRNEFETFHKSGNAMLLFGRIEKNYLSSALVLFTKSSAFYHQGASIHSKHAVPYLLQWEAIREAKKRDCRFYNFWGIAPDENKNHPWAGLTFFKKGFGGVQIDYVQTQDYVLSQIKYAPIYLYEKLLRLRRRV